MEKKINKIKFKLYYLQEEVNSVAYDQWWLEEDLCSGDHLNLCPSFTV
jgi:hypothetical protein